MRKLFVVTSQTPPPLSQSFFKRLGQGAQSLVIAASLPLMLTATVGHAMATPSPAKAAPKTMSKPASKAALVKSVVSQSIGLAKGTDSASTVVLSKSSAKSPAKVGSAASAVTKKLVIGVKKPVQPVERRLQEVTLPQDDMTIRIPHAVPLTNVANEPQDPMAQPDVVTDVPPSMLRSDEAPEQPESPLTTKKPISLAAASELMSDDDRQAIQSKVAQESGLTKENAPSEKMNIRMADPKTVSADPTRGELRLEATDPQTGQAFHIDINSDELTFSSEENVYKLNGDVYIIIPEKQLEILANHAVFNIGESTLTADGNVYMFTPSQVSAGEKLTYNTDTKTLFYKNFRTMKNDYRVKSETYERFPKMEVLRKGRVVLKPKAFVSPYRYMQYLRLGGISSYAYFSSQYKDLYFSGKYNTPGLTSGVLTPIGSLATPVSFKEEQVQTDVPDKPVSPRDLSNASFEEEGLTYKIKVNKAIVRRFKGDYTEITLKPVVMKNNKLFFGALPYMKFGHDQKTGLTTLLGPDFGYNIDYGGLYAGPAAFDFRVGRGWAWVSPIVTFGQAPRQSNSASNANITGAQPGVGVLAHYRSRYLSMDTGWTTTLAAPTFLGNWRPFEKSQGTSLRVAYNRQYQNGAFGIERPHFIAEARQEADFRPHKDLLIRAYATAGVVEDNFFPSGRRVFFVTPQAASPITTSRFQVQGMALNTRPILQIKDVFNLGALVQGRASYYGTGDFFGVLREGPTATLIAGPLFNRVSYLFTQTTGSTPLVFDSYFEGSQTLSTTNSIDLGKNLTIGMLHTLNMNRKNARNDLIVGQIAYLSVGPKSMKFSMSYDLIQQRAMIGMALNPEGGQAIMDFNQMNIYQPGYNETANRSVPVAWDVVAPKKGVVRPQVTSVKTTPRPPVQSQPVAKPKKVSKRRSKPSDGGPVLSAFTSSAAQSTRYKPPAIGL